MEKIFLSISNISGIKIKPDNSLEMNSETIKIPHLWDDFCTYMIEQWGYKTDLETCMSLIELEIYVGIK